MQEGGIDLEKTIKIRRKKRASCVPTLEERWDKKCDQAVLLFQQGATYPNIAKFLGCHVSHLYKELKKREQLQIPE